jgi:formiminotetrahydrofolate cyclodeaminase
MSDEEKAARSMAIQDAFRQAVEVPLHVMRACLTLLEEADMVSDKSNINTLSDLGTAVQMAYAGLHSAMMNVEINLPSLKDAGLKEQTMKNAAMLQHKAEEIHRKLTSWIGEHLH